MKNKNPFYIHRIGRRKKQKSSSPKRRILFKYLGLMILTLLLTCLVYFKEQAGDWFKASVLELPDPFNGTVMPVEKIPNWVQWKGDHVTSHYLQIPQDQLIPLPAYDPALLGLNTDHLKWGDPKNDAIFNAKLTYPVVYLGNYENNHLEGVGSHLAVDIKMPQGTPVRAIANGKVVKAIMQETGFGHHLVIKHVGIQDPDSPGKLANLYSGYNHLADIRVVEGQNVRKGEIIGTSGNTGTSTSPHLHLQIDKESALWHPYWPFSWKEAQDAGLSFFEAVNAGLGLGNARQNTISPMKFIMENLSYNLVASTAPVTTTVTISTPEPASEEGMPSLMVETETTITTLPPEPDRLDPSLFSFELSGESAGLLGNGVTIIVKDPEGKMNQLGDQDSVIVSVEGVGQALTASLKKTDFQNHETKIIVKSDQPGKSTVMVGKSGHAIEFLEKAKNAVAIRIEHDGHFIENELEEIKIIAIDEEGRVAPAINFSGEVELQVTEGRAIISPNNLTARDFENGIARVNLKVPNQNAVVLRAQNGALVGESTPLMLEDTQIFTDIGREHPNYQAIKFLKNEGILNGYPDGSFKPNQSVNRVEALKMLMLAFGVEPTVSGPLPFKDTADQEWYASTLAAALQKQIVQGYPDGTFRPAQTVNRAEYLKILFNSSGEDFTGPILARPYDDVDKEAWFARYAYMTNKKNLIDAASNLFPASGMTRAQVAETIYRMKMIEQNGLVSYQN